MSAQAVEGLVFRVAFSGKSARQGARDALHARANGQSGETSTRSLGAPRARPGAHTTAGTESAPARSPMAPTSRTPAPTPAPRRVPVLRRRRSPTDRLARQLALAHHLELEIEAGRLRDLAEAASRLGISRARVTQVAALRGLSPSIKAAILDGRIDVTERDLRPVADELSWREQERRLERLAPGWREPRSDSVRVPNLGASDGALAASARPRAQTPHPPHRTSDPEIPRT